jgi:RNA-directed DNA polymerase
MAAGRQAIPPFRARPLVSLRRFSPNLQKPRIVIRTESEAEALRVALAERFAACGLVLHSQKTKVVYCADTNRKGRYSTVQFDFLGYTF